MLSYLCKNCDNLEVESSICPVCGKRTDLLKSSIFYCEKCDTLSFYEHCDNCGSKCKYVGTDARPVFPQERLLLEILKGEPFCYAEKSLRCLGSNHFLLNGDKITLPYSSYKNNDPNFVIKELEKHASKNDFYIKNFFQSKTIKNFLVCNKLRLSEISDEAENYIKDISSSFKKDSIFVSFSGGKDSTVTSHLVRKALNDEKIIHIYGDTSLEYPLSLEYINRFKKDNPFTPVITAKNNDQDFTNLCNVIGPPSRMLRWCCTIFKTGAISQKIENIFKEKSRILSFQGIRRFESLSRSKYDRDTDSPKIAKQLVSSPIIDRTDFDVWLYILSNNLDFNESYKLGFSRVGCWCCPNNSSWSEYLASIYMNKQYNNFKDVLYKFAQNANKQDWKEYVDSGNWKARQGGIGINHSKSLLVDFKPCATEENTLNFVLKRPISDSLYTLFKPFGIINKEIGNKRLNEIYILDKISKQPLIKLSGLENSKELKISIINKIRGTQSLNDSERLIKNQITKYQSCIGCTYCQSVCKYNALKVHNLTKGNVSTSTILYTIDENKCKNCLECVTHFDGGCYMKKVLRIKKD